MRPVRRLVRVSLSRPDDDDDNNDNNDGDSTNEDIQPTPHVSNLISEDSHPFLESPGTDEGTLPTQPLVASPADSHSRVTRASRSQLMVADTQPIGEHLRREAAETQVVETPDTDDTQRLIDEAQRVLDDTQSAHIRSKGLLRLDRISIHDQDTQPIPPQGSKASVDANISIIPEDTQPASLPTPPPAKNDLDIADTQPIDATRSQVIVDTQPINHIADTQPIGAATTNNIADTQPIGADTQPIGAATNDIADTQPIGTPTPQIADTQPIAPHHHVTSLDDTQKSQEPETLQDLLPYSPPLPGARVNVSAEPRTDPDPMLPPAEPRTDPDVVLPGAAPATTQDLSQGMFLTLRIIPIVHEDSDDEPSRKRLRSYVEVANTQLPPAQMTSDRPVYTQVVASDDEDVESVPVATVEDLLETHLRRTSPDKRLKLGPLPDLRRLTQNSQFQQIYALPDIPTTMELLPVVNPLYGLVDSDLPSSPTRRSGPRANENAVWASWDIKMYPGVITERGRHKLTIQFIDGVYPIKNEDIYPLHLKIGDRIHVRSDQAPFIVTQLSYSAEHDDVVTLDGYNTVCIERERRKTRHNLQQPQMVPLSQCWLDLGEWMVQQEAQSFAASMMLTNITVSPIKALLRNNNHAATALVKPKNSQGMFAGTVFCFTFLDDDIREPLVEHVENNGGWYVPQDLHDFLQYHEGKYRFPDKCGTVRLAAVVARSYCRSAKYLEAVALGWPVVSDQYISDCVAERATIDDWPAYLLPAGELTAIYKLVKLLDVYRFRLAYDARQPVTDNAAFNQKIMAGYTVVLVAHRIKNPELPQFMLRAFGAAVEFSSNVSQSAAAIAGAKVLVYGDSNHPAAKRSKYRVTAKTVGVIDWEWVVQTAISCRMGPRPEISV